MEFRKLNADEIECRVARITDEGVQLLLYKDARCDMNILDETVGAGNWQRDHKELKGNIYCGVGIYNASVVEVEQGINPWVWKWDAGAESYTEKEKGEASDSFKRACVNWGIGRELYTSPFIWIKAEDTKIVTKNDKKVVKDKFSVGQIEYEDGKISFLIIRNRRKEIVYSYNMPKENG